MKHKLISLLALTTHVLVTLNIPAWAQVDNLTTELLPSVTVVEPKSEKKRRSVIRQRVERAYRWLCYQQEKKTGLVRSYDMPDDMSAWTYDQAVAIIALLATGDVDAARRCADA
ncbi:unnamed protein product, partial [marine sediment metagenome]